MSSLVSYRGSDCDVGLDFDRAAAYNRESHPRNNGTMVGRRTLTIPICIRLCFMPKKGLMCNPHRRIDIKQEWDANNCSNTRENANEEKLDEDDLFLMLFLGRPRIEAPTHWWRYRKQWCRELLLFASSSPPCIVLSQTRNGPTMKHEE